MQVFEILQLMVQDLFPRERVKVDSLGSHSEQQLHKVNKIREKIKEIF